MEKGVEVIGGCGEIEPGRLELLVQSLVEVWYAGCCLRDVGEGRLQDAHRARSACDLDGRLVETMLIPRQSRHAYLYGIINVRDNCPSFHIGESCVRFQFEKQGTRDFDRGAIRRFPSASQNCLAANAVWVGWTECPQMRLPTCARDRHLNASCGSNGFNERFDALTVVS